MPNWCSNSVTISGPADQIERVRQGISQGNLFNTFAPMPEILSRVISPIRYGPNGRAMLSVDPSVLSELVEATVEEQAQIAACAPFTTWHDWAAANWGTKWDPSSEDYHVSVDETQAISVGFDTAWSPPIEFYKAVEEAGLSVDAKYYEPGMCFYGYFQNESELTERFTGISDIPQDIMDEFGIEEWIEE